MSDFDPKTSTDDGPIIGMLDGPPSLVARRERPWGLVLGLACIAGLGLLVFSALSRQRQAHAPAPIVPIAATPAPAPQPPPMPARASFSVDSAPQAVIMPAATEPAPPAADPTVRWKAPAMVVDLGADQTPAVQATAPGVAAAKPPGGQAATAPDSQLSPDERFDARIENTAAETTSATRLKGTALIAPQGTVIAAVTETAIDLDLPGYVRAVVSRDVRGFDGSTVLIPRGSQLIGQYRAGAAAGQSRAFVVWSRVLTPDGISVDIASPGADVLGRSGLPGETNTHFFKRFGNSILLSVLSAGLEASASNGNNGTTAIVIGSQQQANSIASIALEKEINIPDTITVAQGTPIRVFVARDLDFSGVVRKR